GQPRPTGNSSVNRWGQILDLAPSVILNPCRRYRRGSYSAKSSPVESLGREGCYGECVCSGETRPGSQVELDRGKLAQVEPEPVCHNDMQVGWGADGSGSVLGHNHIPCSH